MGLVTASGPHLLDRRAALLAEGPSAALDEVTAQLRTLLEAGEPSVRRITLDEPDDLLGRLAAGEPVHPIEGPEDLADRLAADRRCFVLEHPALPGRPLNVVWVALWRGVAGDVAAILDREAPTDDPASADTAVFYSIWSAEPGARGMPGGRRLLEGAVEALRAELPGLQTFVTLSPIPGFRRWWEAQHPDRADADELPADDSLLAECARYLTIQSEPGRPLDAVARFHLRNGARLLGLHRHGDTSTRGLDRSFGVMANYRYEPEDRAANRASLRAGHVAVSTEVERWRSSDLDRVNR
jgi:malonyl-CoA decarboxylase